jgi:hypothetical protein
MYQIGNIYGITAIAVIGGGLFGFDISSMSAMYDSTRHCSTITQLTQQQSPHTTVPLLLQPGSLWSPVRP